MRLSLLLPCLLLTVAACTAAQAKKDRKPEPNPAEAAAEEQGLQTTILHVQTRTWFSFKHEVPPALNGVKGVKSYVVRSNDTRVSVRFDPEVCKRGDIVKALERMGFPVAVLR
jgi:hypothetical protein